MARVKRDHSGWHSHGLFIKYQSPSVGEKPPKHKSKKDTRKWCRGKTGKEHILRRYFWHFGWTSKRSNWIRCKCIECGKEFYNKDKGIPLIIEIDEVDHASYPVQVKVNGKPIPIDYRLYHETSYFCTACQVWHY